MNNFRYLVFTECSNYIYNFVFKKVKKKKSIKIVKFKKLIGKSGFLVGGEEFLGFLVFIPSSLQWGFEREWCLHP